MHFRSEHEFRNLSEARKRLDRGIEEEALGHRSALTNVNISGRGIAVTNNGDQASAIPQLVEQRIRNHFHGAVEENDVERRFAGTALFQAALDDRHIVEALLGKNNGRTRHQRIVLFSARTDLASRDMMAEA